MSTYENWLDSLTDEEIQEAYEIGGEDTDLGLMRAYHIAVAEHQEYQRESARDDKLTEQ